MGKKSLKNYKKQEKQETNDKRLFQQHIVSTGDDIINKFKGDFDAALLHCLDRKLGDDLFDYIYDCQLDHEKYVEEQMKKINRRIDDCASDVAVDFQIYSEERNLDLAREITGSDISDFVMYLARQKLCPPSIFDENEENCENEETDVKKHENETEKDEIKWTVLN